MQNSPAISISFGAAGPGPAASLHHMGGALRAKPRACPLIPSLITALVAFLALLLLRPHAASSGFGLLQHRTPPASARCAPAYWASLYNATPSAQPPDAPIIHVVFFSFLAPARPWREVLSQQLYNVNASGLPAAAASFDIVLSAEAAATWLGGGGAAEAEQLLGAAAALLGAIVPTARVHLFYENRFEYDGLQRVWDVASTVPARSARQHLVLYFHGKGAVNDKVAGSQSLGNALLTRIVVLQWRAIVRRFAADPAVDTAGVLATTEGSQWYNFWWARASYLHRGVAPAPQRNRFFFEHWLGLRAACSEPGSLQEGARTPPLPNWGATGEVDFWGQGGGCVFTEGPVASLSLCQGGGMGISVMGLGVCAGGVGRPAPAARADSDCPDVIAELE